MNTVTLKISGVNQVTLPRALREALGVGAGDELEGELVNGAVCLRKAETREEKIRRIFRELDRLKKEREKRMTPDQKEFAKKAAGWTANQYREYIDNLPEMVVERKEKYGI